MTARDTILDSLTYRARKSGLARVDARFVCECLSAGDGIERLADSIGYDEGMTGRQTAGLVRDINRKLAGAVPW